MTVWFMAKYHDGMVRGHQALGHRIEHFRDLVGEPPHQPIDPLAEQHWSLEVYVEADSYGEAQEVARRAFAAHEEAQS